VNRQHW